MKRMVAVILVATFVALGVVLAVFLFPNDVRVDKTDTSRGVAQPAADVRQVRVVTFGEPLSASVTELSAKLESGDLSDQPINATVLTDEQCAPDSQGISHCLNALRLDNGEILTVRHNHRMHDVPCLQPGEMVRVMN